MNEDFLHYVWKHRLYNTLQLRTAQNLPLYVLSPGIHNMNGGPDFLQARVRIGEQIWVGNVEIHIKASDWRKHGHHHDVHYNSVVLHAVFENDEAVQIHQPDDLPVFVMANYMHKSQWNSYQQWMSREKGILCQNRLAEIEQTHWVGFKDALLVERLEQKSQWVLLQLKRCQGDWNEVFYRMLARHFGSKVNAEMMTILAERIPFKWVQKLKSDPFQLMALFYGESGMLIGTPKDEFSAELQTEYQFLKAKYQLPEPSVYHWQFFGLRPAGFPTVRMAQFIDLLVRGEGWLDHILELADVADLKKMYVCQAHPYWNVHIQFGKKRSQVLPNEPALAVGDDFIRGLLINVVAVALFAYGRYRDDAFCLQRGMTILESIDAEDNKIIRTWRKWGVQAQHAGDAQALIQLSNLYCEKKRCLHCRVGIQLLKGDTDSGV